MAYISVVIQQGNVTVKDARIMIMDWRPMVIDSIVDQYKEQYGEDVVVTIIGLTGVIKGKCLYPAVEMDKAQVELDEIKHGSLGVVKKENEDQIGKIVEDNKTEVEENDIRKGKGSKKGRNIHKGKRLPTKKGT